MADTAQIEAIVKQVLANMTGSGASAPAAAGSVSNGVIPKTAHVAMLTSLEHFDVKEFPMPEVGDDDILVKVEGCGVCGTDAHEFKRAELKKKLVQKKTLADRINVLDLADYLIMGNGDVQNNINQQMSVKEDLFEAIIGAVALDSDWDIEVLQDIVQIMLNPDSYLKDDAEENYVELIQEWTLKRYGMVPLYHFEKASQAVLYIPFDGISSSYGGNPELKHICLLKLGKLDKIFRSFGTSKNEARKYIPISFGKITFSNSYYRLLL